VKRDIISVLGMVLLAATVAVADEQSWITILLRVAGITASPARMRDAPDDVILGNIWIVGVNGKGPERLTTGGHFRSPVFSLLDDSIFALQGDVLVRIPAGGGKLTNMLPLPHAVKLIGFQGNNANQLLVLLDSSINPIGVVSLGSKSISAVAGDISAEGVSDVLAQVRGQDRMYGATSLLVRTKRQSRSQDPVDGTEVYIQQSNNVPQQVTACNGSNCGQPALSHKGMLVAYIQEVTPAEHPN
jgi:hypothetical protein